MHVAAQNGQLNALKFLVDGCKQDVRMIDGSGKGITKQITLSPNWREHSGHVACHKWPKTRQEVKTEIEFQ